MLKTSAKCKELGLQDLVVGGGLQRLDHAATDGRLASDTLRDWKVIFDAQAANEKNISKG